MSDYTRLFDFGGTDRKHNNPDGLTKLQRQRPNGRMSQPDPPPALAGGDVDRSRNNGRFVSKQRDPVPMVRDESGQFEADAFAVGNFDAFDSNCTPFEEDR